MKLNEDMRIKLSVPFLKNKAVLFVASRTGASRFYIERYRFELEERLKDMGYTFLFLPELVQSLYSDVLHYMLPGQDFMLPAEDMYKRIQDLANLGDKAGFLHKRKGATYFRVIPEYSDKEIEAEVEAFISYLHQKETPETENIRFSKVPAFSDTEDISSQFGMDFSSLPKPVVVPQAIESASRPSKRDPEEKLNRRTQRILDEWERLSKRFGIDIEGLQAIIGYKVKLSRLCITASNRIYLADLEGQPEVKLDDLTKALYFFYLKHPEGAAFKELQSYEDEVLRIYLTITGRDDLVGIRKSIASLVSPYSDGRNSCVSRIKKAFRDIIDDRIAKYYYIDGKYAETRTVRLDRDLVIWEH